MRILYAVAVAVAGLVAFAADALAQQGYQIQRGDVLRVEVLEDSSLNRDVPVLPDGRIAFPLVGTLSVAGRTIDQVNAELSQALAPNFAVPPSVFVSVAGLRAPGVAAPERTITVFVMGEVGSPGPREIRPGTTILQFLSQTGGLTRFAATRRIQLRRTDPSSGRETVYKIDYRALERGGALAQPVVLSEGDIILVPERRLFE
jgi:polysaccharide biosynthesis/export protein